jgi:hypothetical protein
MKEKNMTDNLTKAYRRKNMHAIKSISKIRTLLLPSYGKKVLDLDEMLNRCMENQI